MQNWHPLLVQHNHLDASILLPAFRIVRTVIIFVRRYRGAFSKTLGDEALAG
jgi:hypothetical protein